MKMIKMDEANHEYGFPITAIREVRILSKMRHRNIVDFREIITIPNGAEEAASSDAAAAGEKRAEGERKERKK